MLKLTVGFVAFGMMMQGCVLIAAKHSAESDTHSKQTVVRNVAGEFDKIELLTSGDVEVKIGKPQQISVSTSSDPTDITLEVEDKVLRISSKNGKSVRNLDITITIPNLEGASIKGSGDISISGLKGKMFDAAVSGSGDLTAEGSVESLSANLSGSGDIDLKKLSSKVASASLSGSGEITVFATATANCTLAGSGDIRVSGGASVTQAISGSGSIKIQ